MPLADEASARRLLLERHADLVAHGARYDAALASSRELLPEGDLLPLTLTAAAYARLVRRGEMELEQVLVPLSDALERAIHAAARRLDVDGLGALDDVRGHGTHLGNLLYALAQWDAIGGGSRYRALSTHLSEMLVRALDERQGAPIDSYPGERWPIDTVVTLSALRTLGHPRAEELLRAHREWTEESGTDRGTGLPYARVDTRTPMPPRGSDLSWRIALISELDREWAAELYERYVARFWLARGGRTGFGEWADGRGGADVDSGPIVSGIGATASAFGLATCRTMEDGESRDRLASQLSEGRDAVEMAHGAVLGGLPIDARHVTGSLMGDAVLLYALSW
jgi:hypothetical protein